MAGRPPKEKIDYSGWDVTILDNDEKIDRLIDSQGIGAFTIYFYLCQKAYGSNGYYLTWSYSQCATIARKLGKGASADYVKNTVDMCFQCCLFDKRLFEKYEILTSRGIQKRFWEVAKSRIVKSVISNYWLLEAEECSGLAFDTPKLNYDTPKLNYDTPKAPQSKVKESIVKYSKEEESRETSAATDVLHTYEKYIGIVTPQVAEGIDFYVNEKHMEPALITRLIEYACEQQKRSWQYINGAILGNLKEDILTLDAYNRHQAERVASVQKTSKGKSKFNNYEDSNSSDYAELEKEIEKQMLEVSENDN